MLILLLFVIIGTIVGLIFGSDATVVRPFGDLFLNMLLIVVVPLIFLTISLSIYKMKQPKRIGKILGSTFFVFLITSAVAVLIGVVCTYSFKLVDNSDGMKIKDSLSAGERLSALEHPGPYLHQQGCPRDERAHRQAGGPAESPAAGHGNLSLRLRAHTARGGSQHRL